MTLHTFDETCEILCIGRTKLNELCKARKIGFYQARSGCSRRFSDAQILKYLSTLERKERVR